MTANISVCISVNTQAKITTRTFMQAVRTNNLHQCETTLSLLQLLDLPSLVLNGLCCANVSTDSHTHPFNGPLSRTTQVSRYQKGKTNLDFAEARDSEWQWHQLGRVQVCTSLQTDNHASTPPISFLQAGCPSCRPTNSVKALKATVSVSL